MKEITLTKGYVASVDDEDFERVSQFRWRAHLSLHRDGTVRTVYVDRWRKLGKGKNNRIRQLLHRFLLGVTDPEIEVDHRDGNGLNNQRYNLRMAPTQNQQNSKVRKDNTSGFKGVHKTKGKSHWRICWLARIQVAGERVYLGSFFNPLDAAKAYDAAALKYFGEFALTNATLGLL